MLRCKIFSCTCTHAWCYGIRNSLHEFDHGVWVELFLCCCPIVLTLQSSSKNRDVKRDQTFKYIANVEGYKTVMTTINLSVEIFTSMCHPLFLFWYCSLMYMYAFNASIFIPLGDSTCLSLLTESDHRLERLAVHGFLAAVLAWFRFFPILERSAKLFIFPYSWRYE